MIKVIVFFAFVFVSANARLEVKTQKSFLEMQNPARLCFNRYLIKMRSKIIHMICQKLTGDNSIANLPTNFFERTLNGRIISYADNTVVIIEVRIWAEVFLRVEQEMQSQSLLSLIVSKSKFVTSFATATAADEPDNEFIRLSQQLKGEFMEKMMDIGKTCTKEVGANEDDIAELLAHKLPSRHEGECMVYCFHKHLGLMNEDGTLNREGAKRAAEPLKNDDPELYEKIVKIGKACAKEVAVDDDKCKYATKLTQCAVRKGQEMGLEASVLLN